MNLLVDFSEIENLAKNQYMKTYIGDIQYGTAGFRQKYVRIFK